MDSKKISVVVASKNPVKINAVSIGFEKLFSINQFVFTGVSAESGVPDQPMGDEETFLGAKNRATNARLQSAGADYYVGVEGGVTIGSRGAESFAWVYIIDSKGRVGMGKTSSFFLPPVIIGLLKQGMELGHATDKIFDESNSKQAGGTVGLLTNNIIDRTTYYTDAVVLALIPFKNSPLYFGETTKT